MIGGVFKNRTAPQIRAAAIGKGYTDFSGQGQAFILISTQIIKIQYNAEH